jgi:hypothetical protein
MEALVRDSIAETHPAGGRGRRRRRGKQQAPGRAFVVGSMIPR